MARMFAAIRGTRKVVCRCHPIGFRVFMPRDGGKPRCDTKIRNEAERYEIALYLRFHSDFGVRFVMGAFDPAGDPFGFRHALGQFATGVTVVTTMTPDGPVGFTANSFASVSLDPPLVMWCPSKSSRRLAPFRDAATTAIHVLPARDRDMAAAFTRHAADWGAIDWQAGSNGAPVIAGALATFLCRAEATYEGGDHLILVSRVVEVLAGETLEPLVFHGGRYGGFDPERR